MKHIILTTLAFLLLAPAPVQATDDDHHFQHLGNAYRYWFREANLLKTTTRTYDSFRNYNRLSAIAVNRLVNDPNSGWKVYRVANYNYLGQEVPVTFEKVQTSNSTHETMMTYGYFFIYYKDKKTGPRIAVQLSQTSQYLPNDNVYESFEIVSLHFADKDLAHVAPLKAALEEYIHTDKNVFRNSVVELKNDADSPTFKRSKISFMNNVADLDDKWEDLILDKKLKNVSYESTEGFLTLFDQFKKLGRGSKKGALLFGPPGTGKSYLGQILISSIFNGPLKGKASFMIVTARHLTYKNAIKTMFDVAGQLSPNVMFIEDIDLLGAKNRPKEPSNNPWNDGSIADRDEILNEFLNGMDGVAQSNGILAVGTTNRINRVDPALLRSGRLGIHLHYGLPKFPQRKEFFSRFALKNALWTKDVTLEWLASESEGLSGADIVELIAIARQEAFLSKSMKGDNLLIKKEHWDEAFASIKAEETVREPRSLKSALRTFSKQLN